VPAGLQTREIRADPHLITAANPIPDRRPVALTKINNIG
jgi:hypothetical protein